MTCAAILVAAGQGERSGSTLPKQYVRVAGKAVVRHAWEALASHPAIDRVMIVVGEGQQDMLFDALGTSDVSWVTGGATRQISVRNGLQAVSEAERILVHDAARPFLPAPVIDRLLDALETHDGAVPILPVVDTLARIEADLGETVDRTTLGHVQTPQAFRAEALQKSHDQWQGDAASDDAQMVRAAGYRVATVDGSSALFKLTYAADFERAEAMLNARTSIRTGMGFDVHRLEAGSPLWLCGVEVPHSHGLSGHSDADVAIHALVDALLGALAGGDIGAHFPPSDPQWKGAASSLFLEHARTLCEMRGAEIEHVDVTIICEAPKIGPHRQAMRERIASLLQVQIGRISIKATTTEGLGLTGRREGIAAQAIATLRIRESFE